MRSVTWGERQKGRVIANTRIRKENLNTEVSMTTDPVCGMTVNETDPEFQAQFAGKKYTFCSDECRKEFQERPEEYVETAA
jgi:YHS domain-containing protein